MVFTWEGKEYLDKITQTSSVGTLVPCKEESKNWDSTENLYIEGDNLEVLKLLQKSYHNKIKMIYIDPPYNTGRDFVYKDNFKDNIRNYMDKTGQVDSEGNKLSINSELNSRYHSDWLNMMYPRLSLARDLLSDEGVIFISIDDNEVSQLKLLMDEIFGEENFIAEIPTIMNLKGNQDSFGFADTHEYCLTYTKNKNKAILNKFDLDEDEIFSNWQEDEYGLFKKADGLRRTGDDASRNNRPNGWFPVFINEQNEVYVTENNKPKCEQDTIIYPINEDNEELSWSWGKKKIKKESYNLIVTEARSGGKSIYKKQRPDLGGLPTKKPKSFFYKPDYSTSTATTRLKKLFGEKIFKGSKPVPFIYDLLIIGMNDDDIVLDFFAGSGTTGEAVMQLNEEDRGNRKYIMVQLPELTNEKSEYKNICEIGKERIRRAGDKILEENKNKKGIENLDIGFKVFKLTKGDDRHE